MSALPSTSGLPMREGDIVVDKSHLGREVAFTVLALPATFATAGEQPWRTAVEAAAGEAVAEQPPFEGRVGVEVEFVLPHRENRHPGWDLDNLIKPTIDALHAVIGSRAGRWHVPQADDERVDEIRATKREVRDSELPHATIRVWTLDPSAHEVTS